MQHQLHTTKPSVQLSVRRVSVILTFACAAVFTGSACDEFEDPLLSVEDPESPPDADGDAVIPDPSSEALPDLPEDDGPQFENPTTHDEPVANWNISLSASGPTSLGLSWEAWPGDKYEVCWKKANDFWTGICNTSFEIVTGGEGYSYGRQYVSFGGLTCGTSYEVKVKRWHSISSDSATASTGACPCPNHCPKGGWYDGANCQIGHPPNGTTAFVWGNGYYYTALPGNSCPYPGSWYDGANCYVQAVPNGVTPFIWANHWYYVRVC